MIKCKNDNGLLEFYKGDKKSISKEECYKIGKDLIDKYLAQYFLIIRPFVRSDLKFFENNENLTFICGDMDLMILPIINTMNDYLETEKKGTVSCFSYEGETRITYVIVHKSKPSIPLSLISAMINYTDKTMNDRGFEGFYKTLEHKEPLYIELGCSAGEYNKIITGANYFLRAYILLSLSNFADIIWGQSSGEAQGSKEALKKLISSRGCSYYDQGDYYSCNAVEFLNIFFKRLYTGELLKYTTKQESI